MINDDELEQLTIEQLVQTSIQEFAPDLNDTDLMMDLSANYDVPLIRNYSKFSRSKRYAQQRNNLKNYLINEIRTKRLRQKAPPPHKLFRKFKNS